MTKEHFTDRNGWRPSPRNADNIIRHVNGVCCTINYRNRKYAGVYNGQWTESFSSQREAISALYEKLPRAQAPKPEPKPAQKKKLTLAEEILIAGDGDVELGYRKLALKIHPDVGGTHEGMIALNLAIAKLRLANVN